MHGVIAELICQTGVEVSDFSRQHRGSYTMNFVSDCSLNSLWIAASRLGLKGELGYIRISLEQSPTAPKPVGGLKTVSHLAMESQIFNLQKPDLLDVRFSMVIISHLRRIVG